jgi:hypothetical protein
VYEVLPVRQCKRKLSARVALGHLRAGRDRPLRRPCDLRVSPEDYRRETTERCAALTGDPGELVDRLLARIETLGRAAPLRAGGDGAVPAGRAAAGRVRMQRLRALTRCPSGGGPAGQARAAGRSR